MDLDNKEIFENLDKHQVALAIETLANQIEQVLGDTEKINIEDDYSSISNIVLAGMGGSNLGIRIIRNAFADQIKVPINIIAGYGVPNYVNKNTLYILSSYSGTTEEPLSTYQEAVKKGAKIIAISEDSEGSKLKQIMKEDNIPGYLFDSKENVSGQPRMGLGYSVLGIVMMLEKTGMLKIDRAEIKDIIVKLNQESQVLKLSSNTEGNIAKQKALKLDKKMPILIGAEHLSGNLHVLRNQINETAKTYSSYLIVPDANHFSMEGLVNPTTNKESMVFVFFNSDLYLDRVKKRMELTKQVVEKNGIETMTIDMKFNSKKAQCFELLQFGSWMSYYMGINYEVDPVAIPWVDWFKQELAN